MAAYRGLKVGIYMNVQQAIDQAHAYTLPGFLSTDSAVTEERKRNEDALATLLKAWKEAPAKQEPCDFSLIMQLADRNRELCDNFGIEKLERVAGGCLARQLSDDDLISAVAKMQKRSVAAVRKTAGPTAANLAIAYAEKPMQGCVCGVDLETTSRFPDRGYIVNLGLAFMDLTSTAQVHDGHSAYFGMPDLYKTKGVPLSNIHHITWDDIAGKEPFRTNTAIQKALLATFTTFPIMAHNAAFEDSWFMLHLPGYAEGRKSGKIIIIDSRDICRRCDPEVRSLPRESRPAALETWARRRKTLVAAESEVHLGLDDVYLMLKTVQAEFNERSMFSA